MSEQNHVERALGLFEGSPTALAREMGDGVIRQQIEHWAKSGKVPVAHGASFERVSGIRRWVLYPDDWHRIWPELIGAPGAPAVPTTEKVG